MRLTDLPFCLLGQMSASQASDMTDRAMEDVRASRGDKAWAHESEYR